MNKNEVKMLYEHFVKWDYSPEELIHLSELNMKQEFPMAAFLYLLNLQIH